MTTAALPARAELSMGPAEWALLLALSVLWGASFFFIGVAAAELPTLSIVAVRVGLAAVVLWAVVLLGGRALPRRPAVWGAFLAMGLLNNAVPFGLIVWGQHTVASGLASILNATAPFFTVMVAGVFLDDERLRPGKIAGALFGMAGVALMIGAEALSGLFDHAAAQMAVLGAALSYALAGVYGRRFARLGVAPLMTATGQVSGATLLLVPAALIVDRPWMLAAPSGASWAALVGLALLSTALAYILYFRILARAGATNLLLVTFLVPVSAVLLGALFLGERLGPIHAIGACLIGCGLVAIDGRPLAVLRRVGDARCPGG